VTHRDYAQSVTFVTGHLKDGSMNLNWEQLALTATDRGLLYGPGRAAGNLPRTDRARCRRRRCRLALIQQGTTEHQRVFYRHPGDPIQEIVQRERPKPPTLIIVGRVVELQEKTELVPGAGTAQDRRDIGHKLTYSRRLRLDRMPGGSSNPARPCQLPRRTSSFSMAFSTRHFQVHQRGASRISAAAVPVTR